MNSHFDFAQCDDNINFHTASRTWAIIKVRLSYQIKLSKTIKICLIIQLSNSQSHFEIIPLANSLKLFKKIAV